MTGAIGTSPLLAATIRWRYDACPLLCNAFALWDASEATERRSRSWAKCNTSRFAETSHPTARDPMELDHVTFVGPPIDDREILAKMPANLAGLLPGGHLCGRRSAMYRKAGRSSSNLASQRVSVAFGRHHK
jgi:hypothetical protein